MPSPTDPSARLRGAAVGACSGAVAVLAHGLGGGATLPGGPSLTLLLAACTLVGVVVASLRPRYGAAGTMALLAAGQSIGHGALSLSPGHHHHGASPSMLPAHLVAIPVGAMVIRAAEAGLRRAVTSVRRFMQALGSVPVPAVRVARRRERDDRAEAGRLRVDPGIGRRGPPGQVAFCLLAPA
ncbi:hypothetical protein D7D52_19865 [Nocardia yunnanensis]|uniref:Uncharacterized protein n=1 Tax=Nocardia yunnanensis TaxID=2382165 RepID=A0A386ZEC0_9NOCA|nr:hypothetical protein [Nocardia yunnanensis]AYF75727.1 hypothetical protein D7D52_19865 [Nocardia yunnanensis]